MKHTSFLCVLLCLALALCACNREAAPVMTTQPVETTVPTEPPLDPSAFYLDAVAALEAGGTYQLHTERTKEVDVAGETFTQQIAETFTRTPEIIKVSSTVYYGYHRVYADEIWSEDTLYLKLNDELFSSQLDLESYLSGYAPLALLTPENYGTITAEEGDEIVITFSDATAAESWLAPEAATVVQAEGIATLTPDGTLTATDYHLSYRYGGVTITETFQVTYGEVRVQPKVPENSDAYLAVESCYGPLLMQQATGLLLEVDVISSTVYHSLMSQAGGVYVTFVEHVDAGKDMYRIQSTINETTFQGTNSYETEHLLLDGVYTYTEDDAAPQTSTTVSYETLANYGAITYGSAMSGPEYIQQSTCTDLGSLIIAEFTGNAEWGKYSRADASYALFQDETILDNLASEYSDDVMEFYVAVDKYTGLPTACGYSYSGTHIIDGDAYLLSDEKNVAFNIGSLSVHQNITDEPAPDGEAEAPTPLFYHVTGSEGQEMWLLGTIHVGDDRTGYLPQEIWDALAASDALAVECDTESFEAQLEEDEDLMEAASQAYFYSDGTTTEDHITDAEVYEYALKLMKATGNYFYNTPYLKAAQWSSAIDNFYLQQVYQLTSEKGLESRLEAKAKELDKPLLEVESTLFQIEMMGNWSDELQELMLAETLAYGGIENGLSTIELYALWCSGDEAALTEMLTESDTSEMTEEELALYEEYNRTMSSDRNAGMLEVAKGYLESGDVIFYAVGLAHLLVEDGLVNTLRDAGYTVERVSFG